MLVHANTFSIEPLAVTFETIIFRGAAAVAACSTMVRLLLSAGVVVANPLVRDVQRQTVASLPLPVLGCAGPATPEARNNLCGAVNLATQLFRVVMVHVAPPLLK
mmetsp:Transcript_129728/g.258817  ORF Transcript_129728/g.258817 Transcript_129728/m.258817 type:complete len:105 (-) Transcript_129728:2-316(-)